MAHIIDRLSALRVADAMAKDIVAVGESQTMPEVARALHENRISSAPVVDDRGHCVGIITATDFIKRECSHEERLGSAVAPEPHLAAAQGDQPHRIISSAEDFAGYHMSSALQSIDPAASLLRAARVMCAQHIHRLLVIDKTNRPVGVISTMDIVAALVNVVDEMEEDVAKARLR